MIQLLSKIWKEQLTLANSGGVITQLLIEIETQIKTNQHNSTKLNKQLMTQLNPTIEELKLKQLLWEIQENSAYIITYIKNKTDIAIESEQFYKTPKELELIMISYQYYKPFKKYQEELKSALNKLNQTIKKYSPTDETDTYKQ